MGVLTTKSKENRVGCKMKEGMAWSDKNLSTKEDPHQDGSAQNFGHQRMQ